MRTSTWELTGSWELTLFNKFSKISQILSPETIENVFFPLSELHKQWLDMMLLVYSPASIPSLNDRETPITPFVWMNVICSGSAATRGLWLDANVIMTAEFGTNPPDGRSEYCVPLCAAAVLHIHFPNRLDVIACDLLPTPISRDSLALGWPSSKPWLQHDRSLSCHIIRALRSLCIAISASDFTYLPLQLFFSFDLRGPSPTTMARLSTECHHTTEITWKWAVCTRLGQEKYGGNAAVHVLMLSAVEWRHLKYFFSLDFLGGTSYFLVLDGQSRYRTFFDRIQQHNYRLI